MSEFTEREKDILHCALESLHMRDHVAQKLEAGEDASGEGLARLLLTAQWASINPTCEEIRAIIRKLSPGAYADAPAAEAGKPLDPRMN